MMAERKLKMQSDVHKLPVPREGEHAYYDSHEKEGVTGLVLRIRPSGSRTFQFYYRYNGKQKRIGLGDARTTTLEDARKAARKHRVALDNHEDPSIAKLTKKAQAGLTLEKVIGSYLEHCRGELKPTSLTEVTHYLNNRWQALHGLPVSRVTRAVVAEQLGSISTKYGKVSANRARGVLSACFAWAIGQGLCENNPVIGTNKNKEKPRERVLSDDELVKIWNASPDSEYGRILRLLMLTGCRRDEIGELKWSEVIGLGTADAHIALPAARTKNGRDHIVPLSSLAVEVLMEQPRILGRDAIFGRSQRGYSGWDKAKKRFNDGCKIKEHWTQHDLRRTAATRMADIGVQPHIIEAALNHVSGHKASVAGIYNRSTYATEKREALTRLAAHLQVELAKASGANVHKLKTKA
jgi:integrase